MQAEMLRPVETILAIERWIGQIHETIRSPVSFYAKDRNELLFLAALLALVNRVVVLLGMAAAIDVLQYTAKPTVVGETEELLALTGCLMRQLVARSRTVKRRVLVVHMRVSSVHIPLTTLSQIDRCRIHI